MRRISTLLPVVLVILSVLSCDKDSMKEDVQVVGPQVVTLEAEKGPMKVAELFGRVSGLDSVSLDFECGIEYSSDRYFSDNNSTRQKVDKNYSESSYSIIVSGIQNAKVYYYRAYYVNQQHINYGEVKSFNFEWTAPDIVTLDAVLNEPYGVVLKGLVKDKGALVNDLSEYYHRAYYGDHDCYHNGFYGIECSTTETFEAGSTINVYTYRDTDNMENDSILCSMESLKYFTTYYYRAFFRLGDIQKYGEIKSFSFEWNGPEMVDLGLSVKWATYNVGATYPWDYGDYFAWGETETYYEAGYAQSDSPVWKADKSYGYCYASYKFIVSYHHDFSKYNMSSTNGFTDNKTTLELEDDVAHVMWGDNWRMPTKAEFEELCDSDNCSFVWTTLNGVNGYLITSKKIGYEKAFIFLPASGRREDTEINWVGKSGDYLTSSLDSDNSAYVWRFNFGYYRGYGAYHDVINVYRYYGQTVRPVCP